MFIKRIAYLGYYVKTLEWGKFRKFLRHAHQQSGKSGTWMILDMFASSLKYNISLLEYFQFRFYELEDHQRRKYAGTGFMYEYQLVMNPRSARGILDDKLKFYDKYRAFIRHRVAGIEALKKDQALAKQLLDNPSGKLVLKYSKGQCGWQVKVVETEFFAEKDIAMYMEAEGFDLAEEYIIQHPELMKLSPSGVNTVRVVTQLTPENEMEILGARLRVTVNSPVDNMASGNFAAMLNSETGVVEGPGVYSDITKGKVTEHPVTGVRVVGFKVPYWGEIIKMCEEAALLHPENRSVGWDIAVTEHGPELIEGNHDWCKLLWQLPAQTGLKARLDEHLSYLHPSQKAVQA